MYVLFIAFDSRQRLWLQWAGAVVQLEASRLAREVCETQKLKGIHLSCPAHCQALGLLGSSYCHLHVALLRGSQDWRLHTVKVCSPSWIYLYHLFQ